MTPEIMQIEDRVKEWNVSLPKGMRNAHRKNATKMRQTPIIFTKKKKNGCRLISNADIRRTTRGTKGRILGCAVAFPPLPIL